MISYTGSLVEQRPGAQIKFIVFVADAKEVVGWAEADNIKLDRGNVQRELVESRWRQISKFFNASPNNVIPTSVTIALDESVPQVGSVQDLANAAGFVLEQAADGMTRITFDPDRIRGAAFIIDGQHRLKGMSMLDYEVKVPICLFLSLPKVERAFQFVTINNKSHKVPTGNLKALLANFDQIEANLRSRLTQASVTAPLYSTAVDVLNEDPESPFHKLVDWVNNRFEDAAPLVPPTALENSLRAIGRAFPETRDDESDALAVLYAIWRAIFGQYGITALTAAGYPNLMLKATIQTISEMVVEKLKSDYDPAFTNEPVMGDNGEKAGTTAANLVQGIPAAFWEEPWTMKSLDTSAGRALIQEGIRELKRMVRQADGGNLPDHWEQRLRLYQPATDLED